MWWIAAASVEKAQIAKEGGATAQICWSRILSWHSGKRTYQVHKRRAADCDRGRKEGKGHAVQEHKRHNPGHLSLVVRFSTANPPFPLSMRCDNEFTKEKE